MKNTILRSLRSLTLLAGAVAVTLPANASVINGILRFDGSVTVDATSIDFGANGAGPGTIGISDSTGFFSQFNGQTAQITDLDLAAQPVGSPFSLPNFIVSFPGSPLTFTLNFIFPGSGSPALCGPGSVGPCTPPGSPFTPVNLTSSQNVASFATAGSVSDGGPTSTFLGSFTRTQSTGNFQSLLTTLAAGGSSTTTFAADFVVTAIPEPGTISLFVIGGVLVGAAQLARRKRAA